MNVMRLAGRNILRARRRSLVTVGAMAFALGIMIVFSSLYDGLLFDLRRNASLMTTGHLQIHPNGYLDKPSLYERIEHEDAVLKKLRDLGYKATARLFAGGLAASDTASAGVKLWGVDPEGERQTVKMTGHLLAGKWLDASDRKGVVLGKILARTLESKPGDDLVLVTQAADGSMANDRFTVRGVLKSIGDEIDAAGLFMPRKTFREFMAIPEGAHEITVAMGEEMILEEAGKSLSKAFPELEVKTWKQLNPSMAEMVELSDAFLLPMIVLVYMAIGIVILNAMLMAVFERIKEYGVMKAIGVSPFQVFRLVMSETLVMSLFACALGLLFGLPFAWILQTHGIDLSSYGDSASMSGVAMETIWRSLLTPRSVYMPVAALFVLSLIATIYPAWKASALRPIDAIHHQ